MAASPQSQDTRLRWREQALSDAGFLQSLLGPHCTMELAGKLQRLAKGEALMLSQDEIGVAKSLTAEGSVYRWLFSE